MQFDDPELAKYFTRVETIEFPTAQNKTAFGLYYLGCGTVRPLTVRPLDELDTYVGGFPCRGCLLFICRQGLK